MNKEEVTGIKVVYYLYHGSCAFVNNSCFACSYSAQQLSKFLPLSLSLCI